MPCDCGGARRLMVDGEPVTPVDVQVRARARPTTATTWSCRCQPDRRRNRVHVWPWDGTAAWNWLTDDARASTPPCVGGPTIVVRPRRHPGADGASRSPMPGGSELASPPRPRSCARTSTLHRRGERRLATAVLLPHGAEPARSCPCCSTPTAGRTPSASLQARTAYLSSQWFADQGFAVVVADGRGTPGRGQRVGAGRAPRPRRARARGPGRRAPRRGRGDRRLDLTPRRHPGLELRRLPRRAGGPASARRVPRRHRRRARHRLAPVRHALHRALPRQPVDRRRRVRAVLAADEAAATHAAAADVHGLADDNVVAAHTLQLSSALLAAGRPHGCCPWAASPT